MGNSPVRVRRRWLRALLALTLGLLGAVVVFLGGVYAIAASNFTPVVAAPILAETTQFDGGILVVASDADMVGTAYADGNLMRVPGDEDTVSLIELPVTHADARVVEVAVSNSVTSWPQVLAASPDGTQIYVVEAAGQVDSSVARLAPTDFPPGERLTVIDLSGGVASPRTTVVALGRRAVHVGLSRDGSWLAVGTRSPGQVILIPVATITDTSTHTFHDIMTAGGANAEEVTSVSWHPSGRYLAVGIDGRELAFYRVPVDVPGDMTLEPFGNALALGNRITYGQFTRDGRYYLTAEINWAVYPGRLGNVLNPPGAMIAVAFDDTSAANHREVSRVTVGQSPEGFAVSQQEDLIVTVNMNRTYLPGILTWLPGAQLNALSLLSFDAASGTLRALGAPYGFEGVLPEHAMFDADGSALAVVIYDERDNPMNPGTVEFWNVLRDGDLPRLQRTGVRVPVVRGAHALGLIP